MDQALPLPLIEFDGPIHFIQNDSELSAIQNRWDSIEEFGFDTETRPAFKKGESFKVALLQLATRDEAFVIRMQTLKNFDAIKIVLENPNILKVGVAIRDDLKQLQKTFRFEPGGFVELQDVAKKAELKNFGLKGMTEEVLGRRLSKRAKLTNWEMPNLNREQITYAATDAWIGLELYRELMSRLDRRTPAT